MAKKRTRRVSSKKNAEFAWHFIVPCVIGGFIAWFFTGSVELSYLKGVEVEDVRLQRGAIFQCAEIGDE